MEYFFFLLGIISVGIVVKLWKDPSFWGLFEESEVKKQLPQKTVQFSVFAVICFSIFLIISSNSPDLNNANNEGAPTQSQGNEAQNSVSTGEEGVIDMSGGNCDDTSLIAVDRGALDEFAQARADNDADAVQQMLMSQKLFGVFDCTRIEAVDTAGTLANEVKVRVLEGGNEGKVGWAPSAWLKPEAPEKEPVQVQTELPSYEVLRKTRAQGGGYTGDVLISSYSMDTPLSTLRETTEAIAEKEGLNSIVYFYATRNAYKANMGQDISGAFENGLLGKVENGSFDPSYYYKN